MKRQDKRTTVEGIGRPRFPVYRAVVWVLSVGCAINLSLEGTIPLAIIGVALVVGTIISPLAESTLGRHTAGIVGGVLRVVLVLPILVIVVGAIMRLPIEMVSCGWENLGWESQDHMMYAGVGGEGLDKGAGNSPTWGVCKMDVPSSIVPTVAPAPIGARELEWYAQPVNQVNLGDVVKELEAEAEVEADSEFMEADEQMGDGKVELDVLLGGHTERVVGVWEHILAERRGQMWWMEYPQEPKTYWDEAGDQHWEWLETTRGYAWLVEREEILIKESLVGLTKEQVEDLSEAIDTKTRLSGKGLVSAWEVVQRESPGAQGERAYQSGMAYAGMIMLGRAYENLLLGIIEGWGNW